MALLIFILFLLALDQISKALIVAHFALGERLTIIPNFFYLDYVQNRGAAWGFMADHTLSNLFFIVFSCLMVGLLLWAIWRLRRQPLAYLLGLFLAGALGNLLDRLRHGFVVDFIRFHFGTYRYPSFNFADSYIVLACILVIVLLIFRRHSLEPLLALGSKEAQHEA